MMTEVEYIDWAITGILGYYRKMQKLEDEHPECNLRSAGGQFTWLNRELGIWRDMEAKLYE